MVSRLPAHSQVLFAAKTAKGLTFAEIAAHIGRGEVACAALFYGQAQASADDVTKLSALLGVPRETLAAQMMGFPDRGRAGPMPPVEPLIYRLYEIVQNYGYSFKAVLNEKFGDGIMSAINFSAKVDREDEENGDSYAVITLRGKWCVFFSFFSFLLRFFSASLFLFFFFSFLLLAVLPLGRIALERLPTPLFPTCTNVVL